MHGDGAHVGVKEYLLSTAVRQLALLCAAASIISPAFKKKYCGSVFMRAVFCIVPFCIFRSSYQTSPILNKISVKQLFNFCKNSNFN